MLKKRIIPCLDIMNDKVVKGVNFKELVDIGDPVEIAKKYEEQCADEVVFLDITASYENRETIYELMERAARELSIPLTIGGGIRTLDDFRKLFNSGADKVSINSSAVKNPSLIQEASREFGKQNIVVAIDALDFEVYINGGRTKTELNLIDWAKTCESLGAGEILLTSMKGDGTQNGYDIEQTKAVCKAVNIPVIASGGCGEINDIIEVFKQTDCDAALVASLFHYGKATVNDVKLAMKGADIPCRIIE